MEGVIVDIVEHGFEVLLLQTGSSIGLDMKNNVYFNSFQVLQMPDEWQEKLKMGSKESTSTGQKMERYF